jgi:nitrite reductase/ring-hydroxylating ferredoxin subunit
VPSWRSAARLAAIPEGAAVRVELDGTPVCLSRVDGVPVAVRDVCAHRDIALSGGIVRDGIITCPGHFRRYDLRDGHHLNGTDRVDTFPCRTHDGMVQVLVPDPQPRQSMREFLLAAARAGSARLRSGEVAGSD